MDPLTAAVNLQTSINNLLTALITKASSAGVDAAIAAHESRLNRIDNLIEFLAKKIGFEQPVVTKS